MKKTSLCLVTTLAVLQLASCGDGSPDTPPGATPQLPVQASVAGMQPSLRTDLQRPAKNGVARCNPEWLQGKSLEASHPAIVRDQPVKFVGWYADAGSAGPGERLELVIHDAGFAKQWSVPLEVRESRKDVANALGDAVGLQETGFVASLNLSGLPAGQYGIYLRAAGGDDSICGLGRGFVLK